MNEMILLILCVIFIGFGVPFGIGFLYGKFIEEAKKLGD